MYADPSARLSTPASIRMGRSSSYLRPSRRTPFASISFTSFSMCSTSSMAFLPSGGCVTRLAGLRLQQVADGLRQAEGLGPVLDEADGDDRGRRPVVGTVDPDAAVL